MKPIVGVMPLWDDEKDSIWMLPGYMDSIADAGAIPVMFPLKADEEDLGQLCDLCDGFLFTGGHDVSPELYGELPVEELGTVCTPRDEMELVVMRNAMKADKPLLGICRGIQFVNVALGGSLYQDLPTQHPSQTQHQQLAPYDKPIHHVEVLTGTPLRDLLGTNDLQVNSCHHQAIKCLAPGLEAMAVSPDGLIEALYRPASRFLWAVQWHPEFSYQVDENSRRIVSAFVEAMS